MTGFPINPPRARLTNPDGTVTNEWYRFFVAIQKMIGSGESNPFDDTALLTADAAMTATAQDDLLSAQLFPERPEAYFPTMFPEPGTLTAGTGLDGGGNMGGNVTVDLANTAVTPATYGSATQVGQFTVDQQGRITLAANVAISASGIGAALATTTMTAGAGLTGGGDLSANRTFDIGAGAGITVNANSIEIDTTVVVTLTGSQTLTNKTLTSPAINTATISGGTIDNAIIGGSTPAAGTFTTLTANGNTTLGDASGDTLTINGTAVSVPNNLNFDSNTLYIDAGNNRVGVGTASPSVTFHAAGGSAGSSHDAAIIGNVSASATAGTGARLYLSGNNSVSRAVYIEGVNTGGANNAHALVFGTSAGSASPTERMRIDSNGMTAITGSFSRAAPVTKTADFTVAATENWLINNKSGSTCTVTLPSASTFPGREIMITNNQAQTVVSASSNVVPVAGGAAGTAILAATAGVWATLVSNGTNWIIMQS